VVDLNLRKNWRAALRKKPDVVVFLGDMMDGGRFAMTENEYVRSILITGESWKSCPSGMNNTMIDSAIYSTYLRGSPHISFLATMI
jgi:hypothetical protein